MSDFNPQFSKIGEVLVHNGKVTEGQLNEGLAHQKTTNEKIGNTLIELGIIEEDDFTENKMYFSHTLWRNSY